MSGDIHVVPHDGYWAIAVEGTGKRTPYQSLEAAIDDAIALATMARAEVLIYGRDGQIRERNTYGYAR